MGRRQPKSMQKLGNVSIDEWDTISVEILANSILNHERRLMSVIKLKLHAIDY